MGPYCKFCNQRCFVHTPKLTPEVKVRALASKFGRVPDILATCSGGKKYDREVVGFDIDEVKRSS